MQVTKPVPAGELTKEIGEIFKVKRRKAKVSLESMASGLGCSINTVRWHEAGARMLRADQIIVAAEIIGCEPRELLPESDKPEQSEEPGNEQPSPAP